MAVTRARSFPYTVTIDDEPVRLTLKRMSPTEFEEFRAMLSALGQKRGSPASMGDASHQTTIADLHMEAAYLKANAVWQETVFEAYVTVQEGDVVDQDEHGNPIPVTNGREFAAMFPGHPMLAKILAELYLANALTEAQKKTLQSRSASGTGSPDPQPSAAAGDPPALIVAPAANEDSAGLAVATAPSSNGSSGMTAHSSSEAVPCAI
jgi:hypothetical protein